LNREHGRWIRLRPNLDQTDASNRNGYQVMIDTISRKIERTTSIFAEAFGFEMVRIKPSGCKEPSIRFIRSVSVGEPPRPVFHANGTAGTHKYFTVNIGCYAGINHMKSALMLLIKESLSLNRIPVVFTPQFLSAHNFGKEVIASWDKYVDLDKIAITQNGTTHHVRAMKRDVIADIDAFTVLEVKGKHLVTATENAEYQLIVKNNSSGLGFEGTYGHDDFDFDVELYPSRVVLDYADQVIKQLGQYHSMHVRRGDKLDERDRYPNLDRDTRPEAIYDTVSRILPRGSRIYILTNERTPNYFDVLGKDYQIFQYFDFPGLRDLVEGAHPDNFLLYEIEQVVFARAKTRIYTFADPNGKPRTSLTKDVGWT
jgi:hypothetical protein